MTFLWDIFSSSTCLLGVGKTLKGQGISGSLRDQLSTLSHTSSSAAMAMQKIFAREILDSRGNPTVEVDLHTAKGIMVPSIALPCETPAHRPHALSFLWGPLPQSPPQALLLRPGSWTGTRRPPAPGRREPTSALWGYRGPWMTFLFCPPRPISSSCAQRSLHWYLRSPGTERWRQVPLPRER